MNPAALVTNLADLVAGGILIVNEDAFDEKGLAQAGYATNPLDDGSLDGYQLFPVEMTRLTRLAVEGLGLGPEGEPTAAATSTPWAWSSGSTTGRSSRR